MVIGDISRNFGQVLKELRLQKGFSQEQLALESGLDRTFISMLERGIKNPTLSTVEKISKSLSVTMVQLLIRLQQLEMGELRSKRSLKAHLKPPFFGTSVSCGKPLGGDYFIEKEFSLDEGLIKKPTETFFVKASGDSMLPTIWDGDILIIDKSQKPKNGLIVLAQINNEFTIKRFFKTSKGIRLTADNSSFGELLVNEDNDLWICGVVTGVGRSF
jgi:DNA polymerase V